MHTALVSRMLRDQSSWEEVTVSREEESADLPVETGRPAASLQ
jgi:hypothetical protein